MGLYRLILLRHAEAEPQASGTDHARRLTARGRADARAVAAKLAARGWVPARIAASDARRTRETAEGVIGDFPHAVVSIEPSLYLTGLEAVEAVLRPFPDDVETVMLLGHNPGFSEAAGLLAARSAGLGTAHAALLTIEAGSWAEAVAFGGGWTLEAVLTP